MIKNYDVVILGGGPAGAQCALWLKMLGFDVFVIDTAEKLGGLQRQAPYNNDWIVTSPHEQRGIDTANIIQSNLDYKQIQYVTKAQYSIIEQENAKGFNFHIDSHNMIASSKNMVIATGVQHKTGGFSNSPNFIIGTGCVVDGRDLNHKKVAILGGGDSAAENYGFIRDKGADCVHVYARTLRARKNLSENIKHQDLFEGTYDVDQQNMTVNERKYDVIFVMYGWEVVNPLPSEIDCKVNHDGFFEVDENRLTSHKNIYAIGEAAGKAHPCVVTSMADGVIASKAIQNVSNV